MKKPSKKNLRLYEYYYTLATLGVRFISKSKIKGTWHYFFEIADPELAETLGLWSSASWKIIGRRMYVPSEEMVCFLVDCLKGREDMTVTEVPIWPGHTAGKTISVDCIVTKSEAFDLLVKHAANHLFTSKGIPSFFDLEDLI